ncbi:DNA-3-methyladenine glycosylase I [Ferrimonas lipolytica]|uniref:DNA-3-methyladenine glycosylase I n=1 Tax=Ferrimonas lipolytica TaxID=2724191 RepID=A0A6H1UIE2_9GAMM|nr:DNA-3-methyladenine glycosylase I [Ferrimonas lipolytica]QIZ78877.1 DNA-3-methyladenine glycosylase I [Ferrimonas lipolytica]
MEKFAAIWQRAAERKGGDEGLTALLPQANDQLASMTDAQMLSAMSSQIFKSGFVWRIVDNKWPAFEQAFWGFEPTKLLMMSPEQIDKRASDTALIRHAKKINSIFDNAQMILNIGYEQGSFVQWLADWDSRDIVGLWQQLKKQGNRLGGNTGPYFLRAIGKDTFLLTTDIVAYLKAHHILDAAPTSKKGMQQAQDAFNQWQDESGMTMAQISRVIACSVGDNRL